MEAQQRGQPAASGGGRRGFLKSAARAVLLLEASGLPWGDLFTTSAQAANPVGVVRVTLADFPALAAVNGSIHVNVPDAQFSGYPVIVTRSGAQTFVAVSSFCTHSGCQVQPYSSAFGGLLCFCHGSLFTAQGAVLNGPAQVALETYPVRQPSAAVLEIEIPGIGFAVVAAAVDTAAGRRLRLTFPTQSGLRYEVRNRATVTEAAVPLAFSLTAAGALDQTSVTGTGADVTVHLAAAAPGGFLSVTRQ
ncbi:MAG: hypothetical protein RL514_4170 [Verrucomicrobiota bacterium]|jgi:Rieske Fe-S protein